MGGSRRFALLEANLHLIGTSFSLTDSCHVCTLRMYLSLEPIPKPSVELLLILTQAHPWMNFRTKFFTPRNNIAVLGRIGMATSMYVVFSPSTVTMQ